MRLPVQYFSVNGVSATIVPLPTMEANKDFELVFELARRMEEFKLNRWGQLLNCNDWADGPAVRHVPAAPGAVTWSHVCTLCVLLACLLAHGSALFASCADAKSPS